MNQCTQVPNKLFDKFLPVLTESELKIILVIIRQTYGWIDKFTGSRKSRDRITQSQFISKAGLSPRIVSKTLKMLSDKELIKITDANFNLLNNPLDRKGKSFLYYSLNPVHLTAPTSAHCYIEPVHKVIYNKRKYTKENKTKERVNRPVHIGEIINQQYGYG